MQVIEPEKVPNSTLLNVELSSVHGLQHSISATGPHVKWMCINPIDRPIKVKTPIDGRKKAGERSKSIHLFGWVRGVFRVMDIFVDLEAL